jgi:hypothetical protein
MGDEWITDSLSEDVLKMVLTDGPEGDYRPAVEGLISALNWRRFKTGEGYENQKYIGSSRFIHGLPFLADVSEERRC